KDINLTWNTKSYLSGAYTLKVSYYENDNLIFYNSRNIPILNDGNIKVDLSTDKVTYNEGEDISLRSIVMNTSTNSVATDINVENRLVDKSGNIVWRTVKDVPSILMNRFVELDYTIPSNNLSYGEYKLRSIVLDKDGKELTVAEKVVAINKTVDLRDKVTGNIVLDKRIIDVGEDLKFNYSLKNNSNSKLANMEYKIEVVKSDTMEILFEKKQYVSLNENQLQSFNMIWKHEALEDTIYAVRLSVKLASGEYKQVAAELFNINIPCKVKIETRNEWRTFVKSNTIYPQMKITNEFTQDLELKDFKVRYYYTSEGDKNDIFYCDWTSIGRQNVIGTINRKYDGDKSYMEISFKGGTLKPGETMEIHTRILKDQWNDFDQSNDYSFN
ncbi:MAG: cellulose binding domain-containing protein, partial [Clostridium sp.]